MAPNSVVDWHSNENELLDLNVLTPNGLLLELKINREATLFEIKQEVFEDVQDGPMFGILHDQQTYIFTCVNISTAEKEELLDEEKRICDVQPFLSILRLVERKKDKDELQLKSTIGSLIGKGLHEFDTLKNAEVNDFRWRMRQFCEDIEAKRHLYARSEKLMYMYPVRVVPSDETDIPPYLKKKLTDGTIQAEVRLGKHSPQFAMDYNRTPEDVIDTALDIMSNHTYKASEYVLKVCGREEYMLGGEKLIKYKYVREMIASNKIPCFVAILEKSIPVEQEPDYVTSDNRSRTSSYQSFSGNNPRKLRNVISVEDVKRKFTVWVNGGQKINCTDGTMVGIEIALYHSGAILDERKMSRDMAVKDGEVTWEEHFLFDINVCDIPRMARICVALYETDKGSRTPLTWANAAIFDFKHFMKVGNISLSMWSHPENFDTSDGLVQPLGTVYPNPVPDESTHLLLTVDRFVDSDAVIQYTPWKEELNLPEIAEDDATAHDCPESVPQRKSTKTSKSYLEQYKQITERDLLSDISQQEKELLWFLKDDVYTSLPQSLPHILNCVKWDCRPSVTEMMKLLKKWPLMKPESALGLLDYSFADTAVREYAVKCLDNMADDDLLLYLLQLVQALKYESYLHNDLALFLLRRALNNRHVGHHLFWLLRSDMTDPSCTVVFGLLLEAYCRGAKDHMTDLMKQIDAMKLLQNLSEAIKVEAIKNKLSKEKQAKYLVEKLSEKYTISQLSKVTSPLDAYVKVERLKSDKCKVMDSKMKPFWLTFSAQDVGVSDSRIIFKNGDDLRQDMLTLQMIRFMDKIWKDEGYDFRMSPYRCVATNNMLGLIEVVDNASTIANIQKSKAVSATSAFKKSALLSWLKEQNPDKEALSKATEEFILSCAGYSVATYVLGIGDRHSDNIMMKRNGQVFHIDFGHILGNFKEKFGIKRERSPFILPNDFVYIITSGGKKGKQFETFKDYCVKAFLILRKHGSIILSLFAMMISSGLPELSSVCDLEYLRETLVLGLPEAEALKHFEAKFNEALKSGYKTSVNWFFHNVTRDNK
ncbi:Phosphatidylinositol 4,5-bisphosphate 3-kinase catalytic subunit beta isoform [Halotydeus destructor]|nr:Phosphatidylinositol 4,5-bisphosphate 3-kinase catalytic subunit beta isoform [Halotydeus destructor]